jgi:hypothetical protein
MMFSLIDIIVVAVAALFLGIFVMLIGYKIYIYTEYPTEFKEPNERYDYDWVMDCYYTPGEFNDDIM